jgi:exportin-1
MRITRVVRSFLVSRRRPSLTGSQLAGFKSTSTVLARLFRLVESGDIQAPLYDPSTMQDPTMNNSKFVAEYCADLLKRAFPHLQP